MNRLKPRAMYVSVREYLQELEESGIDGVPEEQADERMEQPTVLRGGEDRHPALAPSLDILKQLAAECRRCALSETRTHLVFGTGSEKARLLFIGEAPGAAEDLKGEPFVGDAGQVFNRLLSAMGLSRSQVYICNLLKCRPPGNRNPHKDEIDACFPFLQQQIKLIRPEVIVTLGTFATHKMLGSKEPVYLLRGRFHLFHGIPLMPTFHPAFLARNRENKQHYWDVWHDMEQVLEKLKLPVPEKSRGKRGEARPEGTE